MKTDADTDTDIDTDGNTDIDVNAGIDADTRKFLLIFLIGFILGGGGIALFLSNMFYAGQFSNAIPNSFNSLNFANFANSVNSVNSINSVNISGVCPVIIPIFSPDSEQEVLTILSSARKSIEMEVFVMTSQAVVDELSTLARRGVNVRVILEERDAGEGNENIAHKLSVAGVHVRFASKRFSLTHSKFVVIDGIIVFVGSHNMTNSALKYNRESSVYISDIKTAQNFRDIFEADWDAGYVLFA